MQPKLWKMTYFKNILPDVNKIIMKEEIYTDILNVLQLFQFNTIYMRYKISILRRLSLMVKFQNESSNDVYLCACRVRDQAEIVSARLV